MRRNALVSLLSIVAPKRSQVQLPVSAPVELSAEQQQLVSGGSPRGTWLESLGSPRGTWQSPESMSSPRGTW